MCEVMEKYEKIAVHNEKIEKIQAMIKEGLSKEIILRVGYTEDEYSEAENQMKEHDKKLYFNLKYCNYFIIRLISRLAILE